MILAIDPGNIESAYVVLDEDLKPIEFGKLDNEDLMDRICQGDFSDCEYIAVEMIASYGMPVGKEVFETCVFAGELKEIIREKMGKDIVLIYRKEEKMNLCGNMKAKDSNIRQALIDRFGVVGTKKSKGWFYGVSKDVWSAIAVGVTYHDLYLKHS